MLSSSFRLIYSLEKFCPKTSNHKKVCYLKHIIYDLTISHGERLISVFNLQTFLYLIFDKAHIRMYNALLFNYIPSNLSYILFSYNILIVMYFLVIIDHG